MLLGFRGLVRLRTWGLLTLAASVLLAGGLSVWLSHEGTRVATGWMAMASSLWMRPFAIYLAGGFAVAILLPFLTPAMAHLRRR
jgi:hypothetical protein